MEDLISKLDRGQRHFLRLVAKDADMDGWAPVSRTLFHLVAKLPVELIELERVGDEGRGRARLTTQGKSVLDAMTWLPEPDLTVPVMHADGPEGSHLYRAPTVRALIGDAVAAECRRCIHAAREAVRAVPPEQRRSADILICNLDAALGARGGRGVEVLLDQGRLRAYMHAPQDGERRDC